MKLPLRIAWRYLFAKKRHNAINIVSGVSAAGVGVVTAALICVLSVMNGLGSLVEQMFSAFDPQIKITCTDSTYFSLSESQWSKLLSIPEIDVCATTTEGMAIIEYSGKQVPATLKGVDSNFEQLTDIDSIITDGSFILADYYDDGTGLPPKRVFERCIMGTGLAHQLGIGAHFVGGLKIYAPKRTAHVNMLRPDKNFNTGSAFMAGIFAVNQVKYDDNFLIVSQPLARQLFDTKENQYSSIEIRLKDNAHVGKIKKQIKVALGESFLVKDRYEQQEDFYRIMQVEKLLTTILLAFILLIASFNIISSLSMLIIEKKDDMQILSSLGASNKIIRQIFIFEGWLITILGALGGLVLGLAVCFAQKEFGWLKLGNGTDYIVSAYPVEIIPTDIVVVLFLVIAIGLFAAWYPTKNIFLKDEQTHS